MVWACEQCWPCHNNMLNVLMFISITIYGKKFNRKISQHRRLVAVFLCAESTLAYFNPCIVVPYQDRDHD